MIHRKPFPYVTLTLKIHRGQPFIAPQTAVAQEQSLQ